VIAKPSRWRLWIAWRARSDWTIADGSERLSQSLQLIHAVFSEHTAAFRLGSEWASEIKVDDPQAPLALASMLRASRNTNLFSGEIMGDAGAVLFPVGPAGFHVNVQQVATGAGWHEAWFQIECDESRKPLLAQHMAQLPILIARLCEVWEADNGWLDLTHVRQEWNKWTGTSPVFSWATWLSPRFATVDTTGLDVDVTEIGGGRLIVLRANVLDMMDPSQETGKHTIQELAQRTRVVSG
jgi:hypothetical protein